MSGLKLLAQDAEDLGILSAAVQDAVVKVGEIEFEPAARRMTLGLNRFRWEGGARKGGERVRAGLQFGGVLKAQARNIRREPADAVLSLLAVGFEPAGTAEDPGGTVVLTFAGGADLRLEVECVDAALADVSAPWPTPRKPGHG